MKALALAAVLVAAFAGAARADTMVSPGKLTAAHAAFETQCDRCHVPFGGTPATKCLACHATLAERIARGTGFHATIANKPCNDCHKEHKGRDAASPAPPDPFDHRVAIFPLEGKHAQVGCERCHPKAGSSRRWVGIASACGRCHADTAHRGALGSSCARCHRAEGWKPATRTQADHKVSLAGGHAKLACVDCHRSGLHLVRQQSCSQCHAPRHVDTKRPCEACHSVAAWKPAEYVHKFPPSRLPGKHMAAPCLSCHPKFKFKPTPFECAACHDKQRPHEPLGECSKCHSAVSWKTQTFDHDRPEVGFALAGRHAGLACKACHPNKIDFKTTIKRTCASCHADVHGEQFAGRACDACHTVERWKPSTIDDAAHAGFGYVLRDAHARAPCASCHKTNAFAGTARACSACHADVRHRKRFGTACERCHDESVWSHAPSFEHAITGFRLERGHAKVACARCHGASGRALVDRPAPSACTTCHTSPHGKQFGTQCTQCHDVGSFRAVKRFDHSRTDFPLELRHATLSCKACHDGQRKDARRDCRTCHGDPHRGANSIDCSDCHRPDRWRIIRFEHDLTSYPLIGRHRIASCGGCHTNPNWTGVRTDCVACHAFDRPRTQDHITKVNCDDCHSPTSWRTLHRR